MTQTHQYRSVIYYVNWAIYGRDHHPQSLPAHQYTHILYSFANTRPESGEVYLTDPWSDTDKHYPTDSWNDTGTNVYGCAKQLYLLKKKNRQLKVLLSIGGWTYSSNFAGAAGSPSNRQTFARSAVQIVENLGLDGLDIDWEYPQDNVQAQNYVNLLKECRVALDEAASRRRQASQSSASHHHTHFELSVAVPAGPDNYRKLDIAGMDRYLDFWNLMGYDYAGSWDRTSGHQANLFPAHNGTNTTPFNTIDPIKFYTSHGVASHKLVLGMPLYGRAFQNTDGPGTPFNGVGEGSWENGVWDYKVLPRPGAQICHDGSIGAAWTFDPATRTMVSFDDGEIARRKASFVQHHRLGGGMWWESSGDRKVGEGSLVEAFVQGVGGPAVLDRRQNCLHYPWSKYDNLRAGIPSE